MSEEEGRLFPYAGDQFVEIVGRRRAGAGLDVLRGGGVGEQAVLLVVDQLALLALLDDLDGEAQLFADLVVRDGCTGRKRACARPAPWSPRGEAVLAPRSSCSRRRCCGSALSARPEQATVDGGFVLDTVDAVDARLDGHQVQETDQPARRDARQLGNGLGRVGKVPCGDVAERCWVFRLTIILMVAIGV